MMRAFRRGGFLALLLLSAMPAIAAQTGPLTLTFNGAEYQHRWSKNGQHEFTPPGQEDLSRWQDMITLIVRPDVHTAEQLAGLANGLVASYSSSGKILATDSKPMTANQPAEHLIVTMLPGNGYLEVVFARAVLKDETGALYLYAHRVYGQDVAETGSEWINANGSRMAEAWTQWPGVRTLTELQGLPESE